MKKIATCLLSLLMLFVSGNAMAQNVLETELNKNEEFAFELKNVSEINTISAKDAAFIIKFDIKGNDYTKYNIKYQIDNDEVFDAGEVVVTPGKMVNKEFSLNVLNGSHKLKVDIFKDSNLVKSFESDLVVMDKYSDNFMDFYNPVGFCTHFGHFTSDSKTNQSNLSILKFVDWSGSNRIRDGFMPHRTEPYPGDYHFFGTSSWTKTGDSWVGWWLEPLLRTDIELYACYQAPMNSASYSDLPKDVVKTAREARTTKSITSFAEFIVESLKNAPSVKSVEIWNEPNISNFWTSQEDVDIDYSNLLKQTALTIREYSDDVRIDAFSATNELQEFINPISENYGVYPYYDCISFHPYVSSMDLENKDTYNKKLSGVADAVESYGGWKQMSITETGQAVYNGVKMNDGEYMTEHDAASRNIKQVIMAAPYGIEHVDIYQLNSDVSIENKNPNDREDGFGIVRWHSDGTLVAQDSYIALKEYSQQLAGAIFVGKLDLGENVYAYLYQKDGKPKLVLWYYDLEYNKKTVEFDGESLDFTDMYGNKVASDVSEFSVGIEPYYVTGLGNEWFLKAAKNETAELNDAWKENYSEIAGAELAEKASALFDEISENIELAKSCEDIKALEDKYFAFGYDIIDAAKNGAVSDKDASSMLFALYKPANVLNNCYAAMYDGSIKSSFDMAEANKYIDASYKNKKCSMKQYSDAMFKYVKLYKNRADEVEALKEENKVKAGVVNGWNLMAENIFGWIKEFSSFESAFNYGITIRVPGYDTQCFVGETKTMRSVLRNVSDEEFNGDFKVYDENNSVVAEVSGIKLKPGETLNKPVNVYINEPKNGSSAYYTFVLEDKNGNRTAEQKNEIKIKNSIEIEVLPINKELDEIETISLKIKNQRPEKYSFTLNLETSENIGISENKLETVLESNEERVINIPVIFVKDTKFRCYSISYTAVDKDGAVAAKSTQLLSMTNIVKAKSPIDIDSFDGDISDWYDAYPIYAGQPKEAADYSEWENSTNSMRAFLKWDEDNLYLLAEVYDNIHYQDYQQSQLWQGDSVQIALDCNNDKTKGYNDDDYELGISLSADGVDFYAWQGSVNLNNYSDRIKIIRDDDAKITKYLFIMSKQEVSNLKLESGGYIGLDIAVNDSDVLGREGYIQFTEGLADAKNPIKYENFKLCGENHSDIADGYNIFK